MSQPLSADIISPADLSASQAEHWSEIRRANPRLDHPYFDVRYAWACAEAPGAGVAVLSRGRETVGFFPLQKRLGLIQPLGAPMTDYHGVISVEPVSPEDLALALRGSVRVNAWATSAAPGFTRRQRMATDVSGGLAALEAAQDLKHHKFMKNLRRNERGLHQEVGEVRFLWDDRDPAILDWILETKRAQYRRTHRHDVFACGWTTDVLKRLRAMRPDGFGLRVASLRLASGEPIAAEASLDDGRTLHLWFPVYSEAHKKRGPGMHLTWLQMKQAASDGYRQIDFGCGDEGYKSALADAADEVFEGVATARAAPAQALQSLIQRRGPAPLRRLGVSLARRMDIINACEVSPAGWLGGTAAAARALAARAASNH